MSEEQTSEKRFFWISMGYATFGVESTNGVVTKAAPIARWMIGKTLEQIKSHLVKHKANVVEL